VGGYAIEHAEDPTRPFIQSPGETIKQLVQELYISGLPLNIHSNVLESARMVKSSPGYLLGFTVNNTKASAQYILLFDSAVAAVSNQVPCTSFTVAASTSLSVYFNTPGRAFLQGIAIANSSAADKLTAGSADCFFDVQYI
jgi:hypothetical protein